MHYVITSSRRSWVKWHMHEVCCLCCAAACYFNCCCLLLTKTPERKKSRVWNYFTIVKGAKFASRKFPAEVPIHKMPWWPWCYTWRPSTWMHTNCFNEELRKRRMLLHQRTDSFERRTTVLYTKLMEVSHWCLHDKKVSDMLTSREIPSEKVHPSLWDNGTNMVNLATRDAALCQLWADLYTLFSWWCMIALDAKEHNIA